MQKVGRVYFINYPEEAHVGHLVDAGPLALEFYDACYASPSSRPAPRRFTGCLYDDSGSIVSLSQRPSALAAHRPADPPQLVVVGRQFQRTDHAVYLGRMFFHFGHFLIESLSRAWPLLVMGATFDNYYFHGWEPVSEKEMLDREIVQVCFDAIGIPIDRVHLVPPTGDWIYNCTVPQQMFHVNDRCHRKYLNIIEKISRTTTFNEKPSGWIGNNRVYFSRFYQQVRAENENEVESIFVDHGFDIVYPEKLSFIEQVRIASNAQVIAGCDGSALHLSIFARGATIISIDHRSDRNQLINRNQLVIEELCGHVGYHVWARLEKTSPEGWIADEQIIRSALRDILR